jgi:sRNA-binding carbon storage regulator CsrA
MALALTRKPGQSIVVEFVMYPGTPEERAVRAHLKLKSLARSSARFSVDAPAEVRIYRVDAAPDGPPA